MKKTVNRYIRDLSGDASAFQNRLCKQDATTEFVVGYRTWDDPDEVLNSLLKSERKVEG
jgi:hypothetical protein